MNVFKSRVFLVGLISAVLTGAMELYGYSTPSLWVLGFSLASIILGYVWRNAPGQAGTISGIILAQLTAFSAAHSSPSGVTLIEVAKYVTPIVINILGFYAQPIKKTDGDGR
jgi:hypothetical protein